MKAKNTICLWYDTAALDAATFYAETFPDSRVDAVFRAPSDYPSGKAGDVLTVQFMVLGIPCIGLNGGPDCTQSERLSFEVPTEHQAEAGHVGDLRQQTRHQMLGRRAQPPEDVDGGRGGDDRGEAAQEGRGEEAHHLDASGGHSFFSSAWISLPSARPR